MRTYTILISISVLLGIGISQLASLSWVLLGFFLVLLWLRIAALPPSSTVFISGLALAPMWGIFSPGYSGAGYEMDVLTMSDAIESGAWTNKVVLSFSLLYSWPYLLSSATSRG